MRSYLAAAIQMTSIPDLASNLQQAEEWIDFCSAPGMRAGDATRKLCLHGAGSRESPPCS
jgi:hypothetical protein